MLHSVPGSAMQLRYLAELTTSANLPAVGHILDPRPTRDSHQVRKLKLIDGNPHGKERFFEDDRSQQKQSFALI
jgi:hypothetical protein